MGPLSHVTRSLLLDQVNIEPKWSKRQAQCDPYSQQEEALWFMRMNRLLGEDAAVPGTIYSFLNDLQVGYPIAGPAAP